MTQIPPNKTDHSHVGEGPLKVSLRNRFFGLVEGPTVHQESAKKQMMVTLMKEPHSTKKQTHGYTVEEPTVHPRNRPRSRWCKVTTWKV